MDTLILAIESSCDETACSVVKNGREVLSNVISSQIEIHQRFGGVVPEIASRNHTMAINSVVDLALKNANVKLDDITAIAVTYGAGLVGSLLVGVSYAKALSYATKKPLIAVSHIKGHIAANYIEHEDLQPPYLCLVVSGGHTALIKVTDYIHHEKLGQSYDDAVGEAFDKVARVLGLPYPGGPNIEKLAKEGNENAYAMPKMLKNEESYNFSYSGLKTHVVNLVHNYQQKNEKYSIEDICASFQKAAIDPLVEKTIKAAKEFKMDTITIAGGVAANGYLKDKLTKAAKKEGIKVLSPSLVLCTDNAAMIGSAGYYNYINNYSMADLDLNATATIEL